MQVAQNADVVIIDTAGRLHNKVGLMNELSKVKKVMQKVVENTPNDVLLVLDGSTGQNAFEQAKQLLQQGFKCLAVTKVRWNCKRWSCYWDFKINFKFQEIHWGRVKN